MHHILVVVYIDLGERIMSDPYLMPEVPEEDRDKFECITVYPMGETCGFFEAKPKVIKKSDYDKCITDDVKYDPSRYGLTKLSYKEGWNLPFFKATVYCANCGYSWKEKKGLPTSKCNNCGNIIQWTNEYYY